MLIKKNSWHYWLATKIGGFSKWQKNSDLCEYFWAVFRGVLFGSFLLILVAESLLAGIVGANVFRLRIEGHIFKHLTFLQMQGIVIDFLAIIIVFILMLLKCVIRPISDWVYRAEEIERKNLLVRVVDGISNTDIMKLITARYRSFKEKTCVLIKFE